MTDNSASSADERLAEVHDLLERAALLLYTLTPADLDTDAGTPSDRHVSAILDLVENRIPGLIYNSGHPKP